MLRGDASCQEALAVLAVRASKGIMAILEKGVTKFISQGQKQVSTSNGTLGFAAQGA